MATNQYLSFATATGANVLNYASYQALTARLGGFVAGTALSAQLNTVWRQSSVVSSAIAQFIVDSSGTDLLDDGSVAGFNARFKAALAANMVQSVPPLYSGVDTSTTQGQVTANLTPAMVALPPEGLYVVKMNQNCVGPTQASFNNLPSATIVKANGQALVGLEWFAGDIVALSYNGLYFTLVNDKTVATSITINAPDVPTLLRAVTAAQQTVISSNAYVTIQLAAATYALTSITGPLYFASPFGYRIRLAGAALKGAIPTATTIGASTNSVTLTILQSVWATVITSVGCNALEIHTGAVNQISNILFAGDGTSSGGHYGIMVGNWSTEPGFASVQLLNVAVHGFGLDNIRAEDQSLIQVNNVLSTYATQHGFHISHYSVLECNVGNILAMHCQNGVQLQNYGLLAIDSASGTCDFSYNTNAGIASQAYGAVNAYSCTGLRIQNNVYGILMQVFASVALCSGGQTAFANNSSGDINVAYNTIIVTYGCPIPGGSTPSRGSGFSGSYALVV